MNLDELRSQIDAIDDRILTLLGERAAVVSDVARAKGEAGLPAYDPDRERAILERLARQGAGTFPRRRHATRRSGPLCVRPACR